MLKRFTFLVALLAVAGLVFAQAPRPRGKAEAKVGGKMVMIDYGRPSLNGRTVSELTSKLGEDRIWRAGENQVTILDTETDLMIGDAKIPAGKYSLYVHAPAAGDWSLCINKDMGIELGKLWDQAPAEVAKEHWPRLDGYNNISTEEVARVKMKKMDGKGGDDFSIELGNEMMTMSWGDMSWGTMIAPAK